MKMLLLALGLALLPIYAFHSGSIQYSHFLLGLFAVMTFLTARLRITRAELLLVLLTIVLFARELVALAIDPTPMSAITGVTSAKDNIPLLEGVFMAFNTAVVIAVARIPLNEPSVSKMIRGAVVCGLLVAVAGVLYYGARLTVGPDGLTRAVGTFNNPNQLAYFAVCMTSMIALLYLRGSASRLLLLGVLVIAAFLVAASESRIGFVACGVLLIFALAALLSRKNFGPLALAACAIGAGALWLLYVGGALDNLKIVERLQTTGTRQYDTLSERGYQFFFQTPFELFFGLGQKVTMTRTLGWHEVHSTFWSFFVTYGLLGFVLFMGVWFIWTKWVYRELGVLGLVLVVAPASIVGLTQNGSRFTAFWVLVAISFNHSLTARRFRKERAREPLKPNIYARSWDVPAHAGMVSDPNVRNSGLH